MFIAVSSDTAKKTRRFGQTSHRSTYMGADPRKLPGGKAPAHNELYPMAYMIEQPPHHSLQAHYHVANQFQIFVQGGGHIGRHAIERGSGHYTAPYSPYGPIAGDDRGVSYLTLRNTWDGQAMYLPESAEKLRAERRKFREAVFQPVAALSAEELWSLPAATSTVVLPAEADGLSGVLHRLPPGGELRGADPATGGGQFWVVFGGFYADAKAGDMTDLSCTFLSSDEQPFAATAGAGGLEILALQFPRLN